LVKIIVHSGSAPQTLYFFQENSTVKNVYTEQLPIGKNLIGSYAYVSQ
jgi:hypothetical protein